MTRVLCPGGVPRTQRSVGGNHASDQYPDLPRCAGQSEANPKPSVRRVIPVLVVTLRDGWPTYQPLGGIVGVD